MPTSEERLQRLLRHGLMPLDAEEIVQAADERNGRPLPAAEAALLANFGPAEIAQDTLWVFYTPSIPPIYKRLWTARTR